MKKYQYETLIENIRILIKKSGMKQFVIAERIGFTKQELSDVLNAKRKLLRAEHLPAIADALGVTISELYYPSESEVKEDECGK